MAENSAGTKRIAADFIGASMVVAMMMRAYMRTAGKKKRQESLDTPNSLKRLRMDFWGDDVCPREDEEGGEAAHESADGAAHESADENNDDDDDERVDDEEGGDGVDDDDDDEEVREATDLPLLLLPPPQPQGVYVQQAIGMHANTFEAVPWKALPRRPAFCDQLPAPFRNPGAAFSNQEKAMPARHGLPAMETPAVMSLPCLRVSLAAEVAPQEAEAADGVPSV